MKGGKQNGPGCDIPLQAIVHFANCIVVSGQILKTTPKFFKSGFRNWKSAMSEKREIFNRHANLGRHSSMTGKAEMFLLTTAMKNILYLYLYYTGSYLSH